MNWFTSDLHLNHENIIKYCSRPFSDTREMNEHIISVWNTKVMQGDIVYVVGDVFLGDPADAEPLIRRLNGKKILILGNHDRSSKTMLKCGFDEVYSRLRVKLQDGRKVLLTHKPVPGALLKDCEMQIHGHRHKGPAVSGNQINVCVDLWGFEPVSETEICQIPLSSPLPSVVKTEFKDGFVTIEAKVPVDTLEGLLGCVKDQLNDHWRAIKENQ